MSSPPRATVAILSIGQMGLGIAQLLQAHDYRVITNVSDRSRATQERAISTGIELANSDESLVAHADYILSIVPPRDAIATAKRVEVALGKATRDKKGELYYLDLNAISPSTVKEIYASLSANAPSVRFIDGGIIGGPPAPSESEVSGWTRPDVPLSGPHALHDAPIDGAYLADTLNSRYLGEQIGSASGLKCCFAALSKGFTALALQSFTTASSLGVLGALQEYMDVYNPGAKQKAEKSIVGCTTKAYRWVEEMNQIGQCFAEEGGFRAQAQVFRQIAGVYDGLADVVEEKGTSGMASAGGVVQALGESLKHE
ncbi:6-phosphogluconate dehydrogenase C-terminal domain-like protein [Cucurbitaria berberidis CBS 394.84]|uniref:6-phosphogluconate dehydrogenase C-terminal domain-like protein n=1 Tax=Cucurbitaria berberidis CBS 394.84 TaxID=1168544 RepID=A0A9P4GAF0_9PLEO|nr:6-phosphogluconate dehydrogenase C-terminal domain-like protein [Cucurbitaria berberidis CBS 394.84]KAF1841811.1 6-phosphogluconate dehydrogenase C-terminal domain-like protein [Cucurbitaria berberidis CBS 394.84]